MELGLRRWSVLEKMKILFIYPPRENYIFGITPHVYIEADSGNYPPIGMLYIAGYLEKYLNVSVKVLDAYTDRMTHLQVKEFIEKEKPDIVGIYFSTYYLYDALLVAEHAKKCSKDITVVAGGPHIMLYPKETILLPTIDYVIQGEAEASFCELVRYIDAKDRSKIDMIPNLLSKESSAEKILTPVRNENLDALPYPARHLLDYRKYRSILTKKNPMTTVITSRGCPFKCYFCSNIESGKRVRYRTPKNVVDELQYLKTTYGLSDYLFFDELFTSDKKRTIEICEEILKRKLRIRWHCRSRIDVLDEQMIKIMQKAGCRLIQFGIETGTDRVQKLINKNINLEKARETIKMIYNNGIYTYADFIFGLPTETDEETKATLSYAESLKLDYVAFGSFHPIPGSVFYERFVNEHVMEDFWKEFILNPKVPIRDYTYTRIDRAKHEKIVAEAYHHFYFRAPFMINKLLRIDSFRQLMWQLKSAFRIFVRFFRFN
jgi:anaerobic magnesium-protoporphyrin IX monomethyl ester cyclase